MDLDHHTDTAHDILAERDRPAGEAAEDTLEELLTAPPEPFPRHSVTSERVTRSQD